MAEAPSAPAAPAAAPAAPVTPPPSAPSTTSTPTPSSGFDSLDARIQPKAKPAAPDKPKEKAAAPAPAAAPDKPKTESGPKQLREQLDKVTGDLTAKVQSISALEARIKEFERRGIDTTALTERLTAAEKRESELQGQIRRLKREASPDFKEKHDKPFNQAAEFAKRIITQLQVNEGDEENPTVRQAVWEDFADLYNMPSNKAAAKARQLFGDDAPVVIQHLMDLQKLDFQRGEALKEEQAKWKQTEDEEIANESRHKEFIQGTWSKVNQDIAERRPEWYLEDPKDPEGNELLKEGYALVDSKPATIQERIVKDAHVRLKAAAFPRLAQRNVQLQEKLDDALAKIAQYEGSQPGPTSRPASGADADSTQSAGKPWKDDLKEALT